MHFLRFTFVLFILIVGTSLNGQVGINSTGDNPDNSAMLDITSSDKGMLIPRMGSSDRTMIPNPADGLMVYDTTTTSFWFYDNFKWNEIGKAFDQLTPGDLIGSAADPDFSCLQETGSESIGSVPTDVAVSGNYAYVIHFTSNDLRVYDISDSANPSEVGNLVIGSNLNSIDVEGNYVYIIENGSNLLRIINVSDPTSPTQVGSIGLGLALEGLTVKNNFAYVVSSVQNNMKIVDVSNPASPSLVSTFGGGKPRSIDVMGQYAYAVSLQDDILRIIDISTPSSPSLEGTLALPSKPYKISVYDNYAYVINILNDSLDIIDISNPTSPMIVGNILIGPSPEDIVAIGTYAFVLDYSNLELVIVDASDSTNPSILNTVPVGSSPIAIDVHGNYAYVVDDTNNDMKVIQLICPATTFAFNPLSNSFEVLEAFPVDNMGDHKATQNIELGTNWLSGDGDDEGLSVDSDGKIGVGTSSPSSTFQINGSNGMSYTDTGAATGTFTVDETHYTIRVFNSIGTIALPDPAAVQGRIYRLIGSNGIATKTITIGGSGIIYDDVTNATISTLSSNQRIVIQSDGTNWIVVGN